MNRPPHDPLDAHERLLADRLARESTASPPPALDAAILAAARAAVAGTPAAPARVPRHHRRRWPLGMGMAAAVLVAVGVAWQLRPLPDARPGSALPATPAAQVAGRPARPPVAATRIPTDSQPSDTASDDAAIGARVLSAPVSSSRSMAPDATPPPDAIASAPPATAPAAPAAGIGDAATTAPRATAFGADAVIASQAPAQPVGISPATARAAMSVTRDVDLPAPHLPALTSTERRHDDDQPPATVDAPEVRQAWLERVRELLDTGDITAARASLAEFHRRHPQADLPADLRALLD